MKKEAQVEESGLQLLYGNLEKGDVKPGRKSVPLEEGLLIAGYGRYHRWVILAVGMALFSALTTILVMSYVVPAMACSLHLSSTQKGLLTSMSFVGMVFSSQLFGYLGDKLGRRGVILPCLVLVGSLCLLSSLAPNLTVLQVIWFVNGFMIAGIITPAFVYASEMTSLPHRASVLLVASAIASLASTYVPCVAWVILPLDIGVVSWRLLLGLSALPPLVAAALMSRLPESPKFLLCQGRKEESLDVIRQIHVKNSPNDVFPIVEVILDDGDEDSSGNDAGFFSSICKQTVVLFKPPLLLYMVLSCALQFGVLGSYNVVMLWFPELVDKMTKYLEAWPEYGVTLCEVLAAPSAASESLPEILDPATCKLQINRIVFVANILVGLLQFAAFCLTSYLTRLIGRKALIVTFLVVPSVCTFLVTLVSSLWLTVACLGLVVVLVGGAMPISMGILVDFFPTHVRSMAACICMIFGRIGAAGGSQIFGLYQETHCEPAYYIVSVSLLLSGVLCIAMKIKDDRK